MRIKRKSSIPKLSWCLIINNQQSTLLCGLGVETKADAFVEGCWTDDFDSFDFIDAEQLIGSGGLIKKDKVIIATPTHTLENLYQIKIKNIVYVSNSLPMLLVESKTNLDNLNHFYYREIYKHNCNLKQHKSMIKVLSNNQKINLNIYHNCNIIIDENLKVITKDKKKLKIDFKTYDDYVHFLRTTIKQLIDNANSKNRILSYQAITAISSGYDSPACSVLAKEVGATQAITIEDARRFYLDSSDSGEVIAKQLGLEVTKGKRDDYLNNEYVEAEFFALGSGGEEVVFSPFSEILKNKVLFNGYFGDTVWKKN